MLAVVRSVVTGDFRSHAYGIVIVERLNSQLTAGHPSRGSARNFVNVARCNLLRQSVVTHRFHGGSDPLGPHSLRQTHARERLQCMPLLGLADGAKPESPHHGQQEQPMLQLAWQPHAEHGADVAGVVPAPAAAPVAAAAVAAHIAVPAAVAAAAGDQAAPGPPHALAASSTAVVPFGETGDFLEYITVERENPAVLYRAEDLPAKRKNGLNPYLLELNKHMQAAKMMKGRSLTELEATTAREDFKERWSEMADRDVYKEAFKEWRLQQAAVPEQKVPTYKASWGGGCHSTPITKDELHQHITEFGWPKVEEVRDDVFKETRAAKNTEIDFSAASA